MNEHDMDFKSLKFVKCSVFEPKEFRYSLPVGGFNFLFSYNYYQVFFSGCKSCLLHSKVTKDGTNKKSIYATLGNGGSEIEFLYKKFRKLEKELGLEPCNVETSEFKGFKLLHFNDPKKYSNFVALELLAIIIKHSIGKNLYTEYNYNGILTKMWGNMPKSIAQINKLKKEDLSKFLSGTGALTWSKTGLFNEILKAI